ncbi:hypothetical protein BFV94_1913 [Alteromonas macleodii]|uniref:Uncharacterized protein n=1 Tax=Alteromonas macleodii TaxID=28108 RepID=A0AB36FW39_ALTMA|nr:hypothetical protein BFV95_1912 [Alteromonas macleodii]OES32947.1 hypothetical protein BFV94_1913 [Alteromonas macleodii]OES33017.1 hypothetical protein BFV93_1905 [Alteromonas macleodii]OES41496.1 hypothetical protein BFV96_1913 [Alteromonas macleodii]
MVAVNDQITRQIPRGAAFDHGINATSWLYYAPRLKAIK